MKFSALCHYNPYFHVLFFIVKSLAAFTTPGFLISKFKYIQIKDSGVLNADGSIVGLGILRSL